LGADWLTYWIEEPSRYWHDTRMPKLRLTRVEAASIAQYLMTLKDEPKDSALVTPDETSVLANVANVFLNWALMYGKLGLPVLGVVGCG
jgi:hypothetical protein